MKRKAFTLLELLLANMLIAILLGALLLLISSLSREQKKMTVVLDQDPTRSILALLRHDLSNSESARALPNQRGFILTGHAGLDSKTLTPTDRRARVIYEIRRRGNVLCLIREQSYLDDPIKPQRFEELIATNITSLSISGSAASTPADDDELNINDTTAFTLPSSVSVHLGMPNRAMNQELFLR
jgi:type II secretory pathway pseudopilin PulG